MSVEKWQRARLIPTSGISGQDEQEGRATSALLAVLPVVRDFATALLKPLGAPSGHVETFIEIPFETDDGRAVRPDGLIRVNRGQRSWVALVEVKTGTAELRVAQVESYLDVARAQGFDAVLTISNQIVATAGSHPVEVDKRRLKRVALHHYSWSEIVAAAINEGVHRGQDDREQAFILSELIRYLEHPKSGAADFSDMGASWTTVRDAVASGTLRRTDNGVAEVCARFDQLMRFAALRLQRELGKPVKVVLARREIDNPSLRLDSLKESIVGTGTLGATLRVANTIADMRIETDLRTGRCSISVVAEAPTDGRALTRVNWLVRQLADAPDGLRIDLFARMSRGSTSELLKTVRGNPAVLLPDPKADVTRFQLTATSPLGTKRGVGRGAYIDSVLAAIDGFYRTVLQDLRPWAPKAPQFPRSGSVTADAGIDTTTISIENEESAEFEAAPGEVRADSPILLDAEAAEVAWDVDLHILEEERATSNGAAYNEPPVDDGSTVGSDEPEVTATSWVEGNPTYSSPVA